MRMKPETREAIQKMNAAGASEDDIAAAVKMKPATVRSVLHANGHHQETDKPRAVKAMQRAKIQELAADGMDRNEIAKIVGVNRKRVDNVLYADARTNGKKPRRQATRAPRATPRRSIPARPSVPAGVVDELDALRQILDRVAILGDASLTWLRTKLEAEWWNR